MKASSIWAVYEDFKPYSEWQDDAQNHNLIIHLPGFVKEQLRVSTEGRSTIRVRGERLVGGDKWSRFFEDFEVPQNSDMNLVRAKFHEGALTITVPKKMANKPTLTLEKEPPKSSDSQHAPQQTNAPSKENISKKSTSPEEKHGSSRDGAAGAFDEEKPKEEKKPEDKARKIKRKPDEGAQTEENGRGGGDHEVLTKKAVKGVDQLNEERQLMVNVGVAVLVIVSITALITYKLVAADNKK